MIMTLLIRIKLDSNPFELSGQSATKFFFQSEPYLLSIIILLKLTHEVILHAAQHNYVNIVIPLVPGLIGLKIPHVLSNIAMLKLS